MSDPADLNSGSDELLLLLGHELKQPLIAISQLSEIDSSSEMIRAYSKRALRTIDNVLLYGRVSSGQAQLDLGPVHVGSVIHDVSQAMQPLMKSSGCRTELNIQHSLRPVDVDRQLFEGALASLWQAMIGAMNRPADIICRAKKSGDEIRLSLTSSEFTDKPFNLTDINTSSSQPISAVAGPATDLIIAKQLFKSIGGELTKVSTRRSGGLSVALKVSRQLKMV